MASSLFSASCRDNQSNVSSDLISAFANSCTSRGFWSDAALTHTHKLVGVLQSLKDKDECRAFNDTFNKVASLERQLDFMLNNTAYREYRQAEETIHEITLELKRPEVAADPVLSLALTTAMAEAKATLAQRRAASNSAQFLNATAQTAQTLQALTSQARDLSACLNQSPGASVKLATNALAVAGSFITPVVGAAVGGLGTLLNGAVDYARHKGTNDSIWKAYSSSMPMALTCGLESMTQLYCKANDAFSIIELQRDNYTENGPTDLWKSLDILGRRLPVLNRWVQKVKTGVVPSNPDEAARQLAVWKKQQNLDNAILDAEGQLNLTQQYYEAAKGKPDTQKNLVIRFVHDAAGAVSGGCTSNGQACDSNSPFRQLSTDWRTYVCYFVLGLEKSKTACPVRDQAETSEEFVRNKLIPMVSLDAFILEGGLRNNWIEIVNGVRAIVDIEFSETITVDPTSLLDLAYQSMPDNVSPREVLEQLKDFLEESKTLPASKGNPHHMPLIEATLETVMKVIDALESTDPKETAKTRVATIFKELQLRNGARVFTERLTSLLTADVRTRLKNGDFPKDISDVIKSAGVDVHERLAAAGVGSLGDVVTDINQSQSLVQSNITNFVDFFGPSFVRAIKELDVKARKAREPATGVHRPNGQSLAKLCLLLASTGYQFRDKQALQLCQGARLTSLYADPKKPDEALDIELGKVWHKLKRRPYMDRVCAYYRFMRAERLAEIVRTTRFKREPKFTLRMREERIAEPAIGLDWAF